MTVATILDPPAALFACEDRRPCKPHTSFPLPKLINLHSFAEEELRCTLEKHLLVQGSNIVIARSCIARVTFHVLANLEVASDAVQVWPRPSKFR